MMSIAKIEADNQDYLFKHSTQEYFEEQENEKGTFLGKMSEFHKIKDKEVTKKLYDKYMSFGEKDFKGVEIDPSPSKDWTVLYNRADEETREKMNVIWDKTMQEVAKSIEQNTYYRETKDGKTEYKLAKAVLIAKFDHHTARPVNGVVDCQEHSHLVIFPKVLGQDNKFHSHTLMDLKYEKNGHETLRLFDSVMNYHLAKGLNSLGFSVSPSKAGFTIDGLDGNIAKEFSKRSNQINDIAGEEATYAEKKKISLKVRENKTKNDINKLRQGWQSTMDRLGFRDINILKSKQKDFDKSLSDISKERDKLVFSNKELKALAYQEATFSNKTFEEKLTEFKNDKYLEKVSNHQNIFAKSFAMKSFSKRVKSLKLRGSLAKNNSLKSAKPSQAKPSKTKSIKARPSQTNTLSNRESDTIQECLSEIKSLESQLLNLKLDDPQRVKIEGKIGDLKERMKSIERENKASLSAKANISKNSRDSSSLQNEEKEEEQEDKKQPKSLEEEKAKGLKSDEELAEEFSQELDNKEHLGNLKLNSLTQQASQNAIKQNLQQVQTQQIDIAPAR
jgi:conjugative relaxase-like TrwC/TraI family protein